MTTSQHLDALQQELLDANVCSHLRETATQLVMGSGNPDADIVFIGEAPGRQEDEQGLPFVGASGKFLNEMLAAAGMKREDVYITNIVKYRPPNNRDPAPDEKRAFWPYLMRQLEIIKPRVVITLGRHSGAAFIPDLHISRDHGTARVVRYTPHTAQEPRAPQDHSHDSTIDAQGTSWLVVPLYHPAAALYNGGMRQTLIDDFIATKALCDQQVTLKP